MTQSYVFPVTEKDLQTKLLITEPKKKKKMYILSKNINNKIEKLE